MGIFSRTRDIIAANVTDLLDRAEDPATMIRMIIMEMEETLVEVRASAARTIADQKEMRRTIAKIELAQSNWAEKAELALSKGREDLAKAALVEKSKLGSMAHQMQAEIATLDEALMHHEADIQKLEAKLREARGRQNAVLSRRTPAQPVSARRPSSPSFSTALPRWYFTASRLTPRRRAIWRLLMPWRTPSTTPHSAGVMTSG